MASGPITAWQIEGKGVEVVTHFLFLGPKITADGNYSHEIRTRLLLGRKAMINLDRVLKSRDVTLPKKVHIVKAVKVFPVVTYGCESWTVKKAECQRIGAFKLWCWRRFLKVLWAAMRSNQSILREISPEYSLIFTEAETPVFLSSDMNRQLTGKPLILGKIKGRRRGH